MNIELLLLILLVVIVFWSLGLLILRSRNAVEFDAEQNKKSAYDGLGYFSKLFLLLSISSKPWICLLLIGMLALAIAFAVAEIFSLLFLEAVVLATFLSCITLYSLKEFAAYKRRKFENNLVEAIEIIRAASISGASPQSALMAVADTVTGDVKKEFSILARALNYGSSIESATARVAALYDCEGTRMLVQVLIARWNIGGNLAELMGSLARVLRERIAMRMQVAGKLSGAKYASIFMGIAPYLLIPYFLTAQPAWLDIFVMHPAGVTVFTTALVLQLIGFIWLRRVLRIDL